MKLAASGYVMDTNAESEKNEKNSKITIRLRRKDVNGENNVTSTSPTAPANKTQFSLQTQVASDQSKHSVIDARSTSPLGHFSKRWISQSLPSSPTHSVNKRDSPTGVRTFDKSFEKSKFVTQSNLWKKNSPYDSRPGSDSSSIASVDSAFEEETSKRGSSRNSQSSGGSTTPTPGSPDGEERTFLEKEQGTPRVKSKHKRRSTEPASSVELNIENKNFTEQDKQILERYFSTSSKTSGPKGDTNFINSAVFKENRNSKDSDAPSFEQPIKPLNLKPLTPTHERTVIHKNRGDKVRVFPPNSPKNVITTSSTRVSSLVKHFDISASHQNNANEKSKFSFPSPQRPASAGRMTTYSTLPRRFSEDTANISFAAQNSKDSSDLVKNKPYETNLFESASRRQAFLSSYMQRLQKNSDSQLLENILSPLSTPEMKRPSYTNLTDDGVGLQEMRPMSTSMLLIKQDSFTNDPYKRKDFLDKYLTRKGQTHFFNKKKSSLF